MFFKKFKKNKEEKSKKSLTELAESIFFHRVKEEMLTKLEDPSEYEKYYQNIQYMLASAKKAGQSDLYQKLEYHLYCVDKQITLKDAGLEYFVYRDVFFNYAETVSKNVIKFCELEKYPRLLPDKVLARLDEYKGLFDQLYIAFTDYTATEIRLEKDLEKERDPILFGTFEDRRTEVKRPLRERPERLYFIDDWIDEYCDLTLAKLVEEYELSTGKIALETMETMDLDTVRNTNSLYNEDMRKNSNLDLATARKLLSSMEKAGVKVNVDG